MSSQTLHELIESLRIQSLLTVSKAKTFSEDFLQITLALVALFYEDLEKPEIDENLKKENKGLNKYLFLAYYQNVSKIHKSVRHCFSLLQEEKIKKKNVDYAYKLVKDLKKENYEGNSLKKCLGNILEFVKNFCEFFFDFKNRSPKRASKKSESGENSEKEITALGENNKKNKLSLKNNFLDFKKKKSVFVIKGKQEVFIGQLKDEKLDEEFIELVPEKFKEDRNNRDSFENEIYENSPVKDKIKNIKNQNIEEEIKLLKNDEISLEIETNLKKDKTIESENDKISKSFNEQNIKIDNDEKFEDIDEKYEEFKKRQSSLRDSEIDGNSIKVSNSQFSIRSSQLKNSQRKKISNQRNTLKLNINKKEISELEFNEEGNYEHDISEKNEKNFDKINAEKKKNENYFNLEKNNSNKDIEIFEVDNLNEKKMNDNNGEKLEEKEIKFLENEQINQNLNFLGSNKVDEEEISNASSEIDFFKSNDNLKEKKNDNPENNEKFNFFQKNSQTFEEKNEDVLPKKIINKENDIINKEKFLDLKEKISLQKKIDIDFLKSERNQNDIDFLKSERNQKDIDFLKTERNQSDIDFLKSERNQKDIDFLKTERNQSDIDFLKSERNQKDIDFLKSERNQKKVDLIKPKKLIEEETPSKIFLENKERIDNLEKNENEQNKIIMLTNNQKIEINQNDKNNQNEDILLKNKIEKKIINQKNKVEKEINFLKSEENNENEEKNNFDEFYKEYNNKDIKININDDEKLKKEEVLFKEKIFNDKQNKEYEKQDKVLKYPLLEKKLDSSDIIQEEKKIEESINFLENDNNLNKENKKIEESINFLENDNNLNKENKKIEESINFLENDNNLNKENKKIEESINFLENYNNLNKENKKIEESINFLENDNNLNKENKKIEESINFLENDNNLNKENKKIEESINFLENDNNLNKENKKIEESINFLENDNNLNKENKKIQDSINFLEKEIENKFKNELNPENYIIDYYYEHPELMKQRLNFYNSRETINRQNYMIDDFDKNKDIHKTKNEKSNNLIDNKINMSEVDFLNESTNKMEKKIEKEEEKKKENFEELKDKKENLVEINFLEEEDKKSKNSQISIFEFYKQNIIFLFKRNLNEESEEIKLQFLKLFNNIKSNLEENLQRDISQIYDQHKKVILEYENHSKINENIKENEILFFYKKHIEFLILRKLKKIKKYISIKDIEKLKNEKFIKEFYVEEIERFLKKKENEEGEKKELEEKYKNNILLEKLERLGKKMSKKELKKLIKEKDLDEYLNKLKKSEKNLAAKKMIELNLDEEKETNKSGLNLKQKIEDLKIKSFRKLEEKLSNKSLKNSFVKSPSKINKSVTFVEKNRSKNFGEDFEKPRILSIKKSDVIFLNKIKKPKKNISTAKNIYKKDKKRIKAKSIVSVYIKNPEEIKEHPQFNFLLPQHKEMINKKRNILKLKNKLNLIKFEIEKEFLGNVRKTNYLQDNNYEYNKEFIQKKNEAILEREKNEKDFIRKIKNEQFLDNNAIKRQNNLENKKTKKIQLKQILLCKKIEMAKLTNDKELIKNLQNELMQIYKGIYLIEESEETLRKDIIESDFILNDLKLDLEEIGIKKDIKFFKKYRKE